jgi:hypothetical protein
MSFVLKENLWGFWGIFVKKFDSFCYDLCFDENLERFIYELHFWERNF